MDQDTPQRETSGDPAHPGETVLVRIHAMAHGGEAVGRLPDGRAVFVAGALPGETVLVRVVSARKRWARGEIVEVQVVSSERVTPPCPHFGPCGGCQWQHIDLGLQRRLKAETVRGQLRHLGGIEDPPVEPVRAVGPSDGFGYRNHAVFAVDAEGHTAYHRSRSRELVRIASCPLLHPLLREWHEVLPALPGLRRLELRAGIRTGQRLAMVRGNLAPQAEAEAAAAGVPLKRAGHDDITEMVGDERFRVSSKAFFQVNTEGAQVLTELVMEMVAPDEEATVLDLYAGVGLFALPLSRRAAKVFAVESNPAAIRDLRFHAKGRPIHIVGTGVERARQQLPPAVDLAVADPPREGLGGMPASLLASMQPLRIVLVSCDPAAMARDARILGNQGYRLGRVVPVDLFPHTYHIESVARFDRVS